MIRHWLKQRREELNLSQQDLANRLGIDRETISHYEREQRHPTFPLLQALSLPLKFSILITEGEMHLMKNPIDSTLNKVKQLQEWKRQFEQDLKGRDDLTGQQIFPMIEASLKAAGFQEATVLPKSSIEMSTAFHLFCFVGEHNALPDLITAEVEVELEKGISFTLYLDFKCFFSNDVLTQLESIAQQEWNRMREWGKEKSEDYIDLAGSMKSFRDFLVSINFLTSISIEVVKLSFSVVLDSIE